MKKVISVLICITFVLCAADNRKKGLYATIGEFRSNTPSLNYEIVLEKLKGNGNPGSPRFSFMVKENKDTVYWRKRKHGTLWGYSDGKSFFVNNGGLLTKLRVNHNILWTTSFELQNKYASNYNGMPCRSGDNSWPCQQYEKVKLVNTNTGKIEKLSNKNLKKLLVMVPHLHKEYVKLARVEISPPNQKYFFLLLNELDKKTVNKTNKQ